MVFEVNVIALFVKPAGVTVAAVDWGPVPTLLTAATVQEYVVPLLKPATVMGDEGPLETAAPHVTV